MTEATETTTVGESIYVRAMKLMRPEITAEELAEYRRRGRVAMALVRTRLDKMLRHP